MNRDIDESLRHVKRRAEELARTERQDSGTPEAETMAAIEDGTLSFSDVDDEMLQRCIDRFGPDAVIGAFTASAAPEFAVVPFPERIAVPSTGWDWRRPAFLAAAAVLIAIAGLFWTLFRAPAPATSTVKRSPAVSAPPPSSPDPSPAPVPNAPPPEPDDRLALALPARPMFDPRGEAWRPGQAPLPIGLPAFDRGASTLGGGADRFQDWRLKTVIVRSRNGWGSGAFVSAAGWIISNYHVVAEAAQAAAITGTPAKFDVIAGQVVEGRLKPAPPVRATLYRVDPVRDLALLKIDRPAADVPYFALGIAANEGDECFVVGSQHNGPAWAIRRGTLLQQFDYPDDLSQVAAGLSSSTTRLERNRLTVTVSDTSVSPGDSGGPLLNVKGELVGVTFATSANASGGSVGWHVSLDQVRQFLSALPARPEGVPFDPWTVGQPQAAALEPRLEDGDGDRRIDTLFYRYVMPPSGTAGPQPASAMLFIDFAQRVAAEAAGTSSPERLMPFGLWGMEDRGQFRFDIFIAVRADGQTAIGYANAAGITTEVRVGKSETMTATVVWTRQASGVWRASAPATPIPLIDPARISGTKDRQLEAIARRLLSPAEGSEPTAAPRGSRGPNKMGARP